jgi:serine/threonine-protein kinase
VSLTNETPAELFVVREGDARRGPMGYAELVELLTTGEVGPAAHVSRNGGPERGLTDEPDLARHLPMRASFPPPARAAADGGALQAAAAKPAEADRIDGSFEQQTAVSVFCRLATGGETGLLVVQSGPVVKEVYFVRGRPEHVMSNLAGEMLGEFLVSRKVITRGELQMALAILPRFDGKLGDTLASLGLLQPLDLLRHITEQVKAKLLDLFRWRRGTFRFERGITPPAGGFPLGIDPFELIVEGVGFGYPNQEILAQRTAWEGRRIEPTSSYGPGLFALPLPPMWAAVLDSASTPGTLRDILERSGAHDTAEAMRALFLGVEAGLLSME